MRREYPMHPIIGVGGVIFNGDSVLLALRNQEPGRGQWSLPGGAVELGETLMEALKREIREETSIEIKVGGLIRVLDRIIYDDEKRVRYHYVIVDYWGKMVSGNLQAGSDISEAGFVPLGEISAIGMNKLVVETIFMAVSMRDNPAGG